MFKEPASWDSAGEYQPNLVDVYFEDSDKFTLHMVDLNIPLAKILSHPRYVWWILPCVHSAAMQLVDDASPN